MKKLLPLLLCLLLLSGCGEDPQQAAYARFAGALSLRDDLGFRAELRCEYDEQSLRFTLAYAESGGEATVTVLAPEEIAGLSATLREGETALRYGELRLDVGTLDRYGLSPLSALPLLADTLRHGQLVCAWDEGDETVWELVLHDGQSLRLWLREGIPLHAELISDARVRVVCELTDWN